MTRYPWNTNTLGTIAAALGLAACIAAPAHADTWLGTTDNDWDTGSNWELGIVPDSNTEIVVNAGGTPVKSGDNANFFRNADTTFNGSSSFEYAGANNADRFTNNGTLTFNDSSNFTLNRRFLNNENVASATTNWNSTGTLDMTGNFFIIGRFGGTGTFNQTAGTVNANLTDNDTGNMSFFLSDSNGGDGSQGVYNLTGGELNVTIDPNVNKFGQFRLGGGHNRNDTSINNGHDLFVVDGGTLNVTNVRSDNRNDRQILIRRASRLEVHSGAANFSAVSFRVGDGNFPNATFPGDTATFEITGGTVNIDTNVATVFGQNGSNIGQFLISGGTLNVNSGGFWIGNAGTGIAEQTGGDIVLNNIDLIIGRDSNTAPGSSYTMSGGTLTARDILSGKDSTIDNPNTEFNFLGGVITLTGDRTDILDESWFNAAPGAFANFDSFTNLTTIAIPEPGSLALLGLGTLLIGLRPRRG